jgi:hypothetical protein
MSRKVDEVLGMRMRCRDPTRRLCLERARGQDTAKAGALPWQGRPSLRPGRGWRWRGDAVGQPTMMEIDPGRA